MDEETRRYLDVLREDIVSRTAAHTDEQFARSMARSDEQFAKAMARSEEQFARAMAHTDERFDQAMAHTDEQFARAMAHTDARFDLAEEQVRGTMMLLERMEHTLQVVAESVVLRTEGLGRIADDHERRIGDLESRVP